MALPSIGQVSVVCVFSVQLLISCRLYTDCCEHVAGNPWHCDCDGMYTVYRIFQNGTGQNVTVLCKSPADLMGESWDAVEEKCQRSVTPPQPAVSGSTANTTVVSTSPSVQFSTTNQKDVSVTESSPDHSHLPSLYLVMFVVFFAAAVFIVVVVITIIIRRIRASTLNRLWWEDVVMRPEHMTK